MNAYKIELLVLDFDQVGDAGIREMIENAHYPNHAISPAVMASQVVDIGPWDDRNLLNHYDTRMAEFARLFAAAPAVAITPAPQGTARDLQEALITLAGIEKHLVDDAERNAFNLLWKFAAQSGAVAITQAATSEILTDASFLASRLARVAKLAGVVISPEWSHEQVAEVAGTILGEIARSLEVSKAATSEPVGRHSEFYVSDLEDSLRQIGAALGIVGDDADAIVAKAKELAHLAGTTPNTEAPSEDAKELIGYINIDSGRVTTVPVQKYWESGIPTGCYEIRAALAAATQTEKP